MLGLPVSVVVGQPCHVERLRLGNPGPAGNLGSYPRTSRLSQLELGAETWVKLGCPVVSGAGLHGRAAPELWNLGDQGLWSQDSAYHGIAPET